MIYTIPVLITVEAQDEFHKHKQVNEFLRAAFRDLAPTYNVLDYEVKAREYLST